MKHKINKGITLVCLLICLACFGYLAFYFAQRGLEEDKTEKVQEYVKQEAIEIESDVKKEQETGEENPVDFEKLSKINEDIYAWLTVPGTNINQPIVQSPTDDAYYLDHLYDKSASPYGAVFTERLNKKDFSDFNTVIYGHNTKTVSGFHDLHQFSDETFFAEHDELIIYTKTEKKIYQIFAALEYDNRHILFHFNNEVPKERREFLESLQNTRSMKNQFRDNVTVDENSRIVTLSTCIKGEPETRWIIGAVEINE